MKTKFFLAALMSLLLALPLMATADNLPNPDLIVRSTVKEGKVIKLQLANLLQTPTTISIESMNGEPFYSRTIRKHNGFNLQLDLGYIPQGRYLLRVAQEDESRVQVVVITADRVLLSEMN